MYAKYKEFDFHRPKNFIFSYDMLYMVNVVVMPNLKEWDLKFASTKPSNARDFFNKLKIDTLTMVCHQNDKIKDLQLADEPSRNQEVQKQGKLLDSLVDKFAVLFHYQTGQFLKLPDIFPKFHCLH
jgi:hypothetical protein